ncbi:capsule assembly Wzi family protein [Aliikangiella maris]|uniref:Capsule assembly Wzi family protein n=2 Tax=Aliikangiella maris TaxID=3162458 RepID=A0ABV3MI07_9GAMM
MNIYTRFVPHLITFSILISTSQIAVASQHYLPIKTDPLFELELEKLASVAQMPTMSKPYHLDTLVGYLDKIRISHPQLYQRISQYISRYKSTYNITQLSAEIAYSDVDFKNLPNRRGQDSDSEFTGVVAGYFQLNEYFNLSLGGTIYNGSGGIIPNHSYLSFSNDYLQIDVGYKEIWLSPFQESAMLLSTNAKPIARFNISSPTPWTDYQIRYDVSFGKLEEMEGIRFGEERKSGEPGFLTMHFSLQPFDWWTIGATRTMMFGGGDRDVDLGDVWNAIIDPVNSDNCGGESELQNCKEEFGNQQASISNKFDFYWGMPISIYTELAGEDTNNFKAYKLGNKAYNIGVFLPYLTEKSSALLEYQYIENAWYVHHLYAEGYRNDKHSMGHWWGDEKLINDGIGARITTLRYNWEYSADLHLDFKLSTFKNINLSDEAPSDESKYERATEWTIGFNQIEPTSIWRYELYFGQDNFGEDFARFAVKYSWQ